MPNPDRFARPLVTLLVSLLSLPLPRSLGQTAPTSAAAPKEEIVALEVFEVSAKTDKGYIALRSVGATKTNEMLLDLGHSISVFNSEFIADVGARTFGDAIAFAANTSACGNDSPCRRMIHSNTSPPASQPKQ